MIPTTIYLPCPNPTHHNLQLSSLCLQKDCPNRTILCPQCQTQSHQNHKTILLHEYLEELELRRADPELRGLIGDTIRRIKDTNEKQKEVIKVIITELSQVQESLEKIIDGWLKEISFQQNNFDKTYLNFQYRPNPDEPQTLIQTMRKQLSNYYDYVVMREEFLKGLVKFQETVGKELKERFQGLEYIRLLVMGMRGEVEMLSEKYFTFNLYEKLEDFRDIEDLRNRKGNKLRWSHENKHDQIRIFGDTATRTDIKKTQDFVCIAINMLLTQDTHWRLRIDQLSGSMAFGICLSSQLKNLKQKFTYKNHKQKFTERNLKQKFTDKNLAGNHLLVSNGHIIHNGQQSGQVEKTLKAYDKLWISFYYQSNTLEFFLNETQKICVIGVEPLKQGFYVPCVYLQKREDRVSLM